MTQEKMDNINEHLDYIIQHISDDRDTCMYGPSRTEESIVKLCNIVLDLAQEIDRLQKKINVLTNGEV